MPELFSLQRGQCGEPFKPDELKCYHRNQFGVRTLIPDIVCRYREKPVRLPCTTLPPPTTTATTTSSPESKTDTTKKQTKKSQSVQAQSSVVVAFLIPVLHILQEYFVFSWERSTVARDHVNSSFPSGETQVRLKTGGMLINAGHSFSTEKFNVYILKKMMVLAFISSVK